MPGHPDWQAIEVWIGDPLLNLNDEPIAAGGTNFGPFSVGNFRTLLVYALPSGVGIDLSLRFDDPDDSFVESGTYSLRTLNARQMTHYVPVIGERLNQVRFLPSAAGGTVDAIVIPTNVPAFSVPQGGNNVNLFNRVSQSVGAGATVTETLPNYWGPARIFFQAVSQTWEVRVRELLAGGAADAFVFGVSGLTGTLREELWFPPVTWQVTVTNQGGAAGTFHSTILPTTSL